MVDTARVRRLQAGSAGTGPVVYWMSRDQRAKDNWALLFAQEQAFAMKRSLVVVFCLSLDYPGANLRHFAFLLRSLEQVRTDLEQYLIPLLLLEGDPTETLSCFLKQNDAAMLVTDFDPLRIKKQWKAQIVKQGIVPVYEVDAHNIVPCWLASDKREYAAYTFRPKITKLLPVFLTDFPQLLQHPFSGEIKRVQTPDSNTILGLVKDRSAGEINWLHPGEEAARSAFDYFVQHRLGSYPIDRNNPCIDGQSNLSPYFHFGQISPQRVAWEVKKSDAGQEAKDAYLEELIVRRELADNFCYFTKDYDRVEAFPGWAGKTLNDHRHDPRPYLADLAMLENAATGEELWNACQRNLAERGKLHGYLRMYWAKKILEWSNSPEEAIDNAIYLNDKYSLDGRDPNGYAGIAWSIGGTHDRAWAERPIYGKIRYMNENGCRRKFNVPEYIKQAKNLPRVEIRDTTTSGKLS